MNIGCNMTISISIPTRNDLDKLTIKLRESLREEFNEKITELKNRVIDIEQMIKNREKKE